MFYESKCHRWEATGFCRSTYDIFIDISLMKTKNKNQKIFFLYFKQLRKINMQPSSFFWNLCSIEQVWFSSPSRSESVSIFLILTTCFFGGMVTNFDINVYIIARENSCKIDRAPYGFSYNAGRASADVIVYRRRPAPVRYVTTQEKNLKNRPVLGRLSNSPVMWKLLKLYDASFICDHSIMHNIVCH